MVRLHDNVSLAGQIVLFAGLGAALLTVEAQHTPESAAFSGTPRFLVWVALMAAQVATWPIVFRVGRDRLRDIDRHVTSGRHRRHVLLIALFGLAVAATFVPSLLGMREGSGLWGNPVRMGIAALGGVAAATPCLLVMWRIHDALAADVVDRESALAVIDKIRCLRGPFTVALTAVGVLVTEVTLTTGALRNARIAWKPDDASTFPAEFVIIYGAFFTGLLAAAAVPTYGRMKRRATKVVDVLLPVMTPDEPKWRDRLEERRDLAGVVYADASLVQSFQAAVLVAGPLLTGLVSLLVPTTS